MRASPENFKGLALVIEADDLNYELKLVFILGQALRMLLQGQKKA